MTDPEATSAETLIRAAEIGSDGRAAVCLCRQSAGPGRGLGKHPLSVVPGHAHRPLRLPGSLLSCPADGSLSALPDAIPGIWPHAAGEVKIGQRSGRVPEPAAAPGGRTVPRSVVSVLQDAVKGFQLFSQISPPTMKEHSRWLHHRLPPSDRQPPCGRADRSAETAVGHGRGRLAAEAGPAAKPPHFPRTCDRRRPPCGRGVRQPQARQASARLLRHAWPNRRRCTRPCCTPPNAPSGRTNAFRRYRRRELEYLEMEVWLLFDPQPVPRHAARTGPGRSPSARMAFRWCRGQSGASVPAQRGPGKQLGCRHVSRSRLPEGRAAGHRMAGGRHGPVHLRRRRRPRLPSRIWGRR